MTLTLDFTTFRQRFQSLIDSRGLNLGRLSDELGIGVPTLSRYLTGVRTPDLAYVVRMANYFDVSVDWLLGLDRDIDTSFPEDVAEVASLYSVASPDDRKVVHAILDRYKRIMSDDVH